MLLTNDELNQVRQSLEARTGIDEGILNECGTLMHVGEYDQATMTAFILVEQELRRCVGSHAANMTAANLVNYAFAHDGPLGKLVGDSEREGLLHLYLGAFRVYRNPAAHGKAQLSDAEGKCVLALASLLLMKLRQIIGPVSPLPEVHLPSNIKKYLSEVKATLGDAASKRLRNFIVNCVNAGMTSDASATQWIPFKRYVRFHHEHWAEPKLYSIAIFYVGTHKKAKAKTLGIRLGAHNLKRIVGLDFVKTNKELLDLGFQVVGKNQDYSIEFSTHNDQAFFDKLLALVAKISNPAEAS